MSETNENPTEIVIGRLEDALLTKNELEDYRPSLEKLQHKLSHEKISDSTFEEFTESCVEFFYSEAKQGYPDELFRGSNEENTNRSLRELYRDLKGMFCDFTKSMSIPTATTLGVVIDQLVSKIMELIPNLLFLTELFITASCYYWMMVGIRSFCN